MGVKGRHDVWGSEGVFVEKCVLKFLSTVLASTSRPSHTHQSKHAAVEDPGLVVVAATDDLLDVWPEDEGLHMSASAIAKHVV